MKERDKREEKEKNEKEMKEKENKKEKEKMKKNSSCTLSFLWRSAGLSVRNSWISDLEALNTPLKKRWIKSIIKTKIGFFSSKWLIYDLYMNKQCTNK